ncbi:MAG: tetratricopeptide repeat protein [Opitutaceae bacterium]|nr:tetratricopeptide repeat protein [Opitutaceae bacterium]
MKISLRVCFALLACWRAMAAETPPSAEAASRANLKRISAGIRAYGAAHDDRKPGSFRELLDEDLVDGPEFFSLDGTGAKLVPAEIDARGDYTMEPSPSAPDAIVREKRSTHTPGKILAGFKDGSIKLVDAPAEAAAVPAVPAAPAVATNPVALPAEPTPPSPVATAAPTSVRPAVPLPPEPAPVTPTVTPAPPPRVGSDAGLPASYLQAALALFNQLKPREAKEAFQFVLKWEPDSAEALAGLARCENMLGEIDAALSHYEILGRTAAPPPQLRTWIAELALAKGDFALAARALDAELAVNLGSAWARSWRGSLLLAQGRNDEARAEFAQAVRADANVVAQRYQNGGGLSASGQPQRALIEFLAVMWMQPNHAGAYFAAGDSYAKLRQPALALQSYERYLQLDATSEWAAKARAEIARLTPNRAN